ncbi:MAG TPA: ATP-dependent RecD-like DNA helicase [Thermoanaerobaculia bacterium]|nr:ATP-dependent RecD-like DNA helicase [Thermoanaerobaculia bacterium]
MRNDANKPAPDSDRESVAGVVDRVTYHNAENGFCVLRVRMRGKREPMTVVGHAASVSEGETVQASGRFENTAQHGLQFRADRLQVTQPSTVEGIEKYLGSGLIRGVGKELAKRLVRAFGEKVFEVVDQHPERLRTVDGIGPVRVQRILEGFREQQAVREIMLFLQSHGVGTARAVRIFKTYGADAVPLIAENPYRLARDIRGIGFKTADEIGRRLGIARDAPIRARAGLSYTLLEAVVAGHCALPEDDLLDQGERLLEIPRPVLEEALRHEVDEKNLVADQLEGRRAIFLVSLWSAESQIASRLRALAAGPPPWGAIDAAAALPWVEGRLGVELSASQRAAVETVLQARAAVITGGPGVGKTTLVNAFLRIVRAKGVRVALAAPTGRAARRLSESTGLEAKTIHRLLEVDPRRGGFRRGPDLPLECDLLVIDEASMVDVPLMSALAQAMPPRAALLLVGDVDQLPSVGPGQVLRDVIDSGIVATARLTEIFRQAASSRIITSAHRINQGLLPELDAPEAGGEPSDFYFVDAEDADDALRKLLEIAARRLPRRFGLDPLRDVQVLSPMNRGSLGARTLNLELQGLLNPPDPDRAEVQRFGWTFRVGDRVMQTENDYDKDVFNGDLGVVREVAADTQEVAVDFDGRRVVYRFGELDQLALAYAMSVHKSQGSEYPAVVVPLALQHYLMLQRHLLYTAVTRAKRVVVLVGQRRALQIAVKSRPMARRWSRLRELLRKPRALGDREGGGEA